MQQTIRFIKSADGTRLAVATSGQGPPLVKSANWLSHLEFDWQSPVWRHWFRFLSAGRQLIRFDPRGCGLSDWDVADLSHAAQVADLEALIEASDLETFPLLGISQGGAACIEYAVRHPERVTKLFLYGCYAEGWAQRGEDSRRHGEALVELIRQGWGQENPAFRLLFASLFIPDATAEQVRWFSDLMRTTTQPEIAARIIEAFGQINVRALLSQVKVPTVVVHARNDARIPFDQGRLLAAEIPNATFVTLESRNHILTESEPAWTRFCETFNEYMGIAGAPSADRQAAPVDLSELTARENAILRLVAQGAANGEIARRLFISEKTVRNHLTNIFEKLGVDSRARAIVVARDRGVA
ncbi:alpha/beta fold hydrolase [Steroidobacter flavus]|uniref:Alpha/beta fold hydrolase n=1 Tax=Steroidobacter flavus TaxID=1842136 RepID=A0ABV8SQ45_9GAMM